MRTLIAVVLVALTTSTAAAQDFQRPDGWKVVFDHDGQSEADLESFVEMPPGWHVTSGPAAIYWHPEMSASGDFRLEMEVFLFDPGQRREAFGVILGAKELETDNREYAYFLLRNGGQFIVKRRLGADSPTVLPWTSHEAIRSYADRGEEASVKNVLVVEARGETVRLFVNDSEVATVPRADFPVDGGFGFRVNHALNLHISRLETTPIG